MQKAHIYTTPVTECEQLTTNNTARLIINAIICFSKKPLVREALMDLFRGNFLTCYNHFSQNSFASFIFRGSLIFIACR